MIHLQTLQSWVNNKMGENLHNEVKVSAVRQNTTCDPFSLTGCTRKCTRDDKTAAVKVKDGFP